MTCLFFIGDTLKISGRNSVFSTLCLLMMVIVLLIWAFMFRVNGSMPAAIVLLSRPKSVVLALMIIGLYTITFVKPFNGILTIVNGIMYTTAVAMMLTVDVLIDRHRKVIAVLFFFVVIFSVFNLLAWYLTNQYRGVVLVKIWGRTILKRNIARSLVSTVLIQCIEGIITLLRTPQVRLGAIYIFLKQGVLRPSSYPYTYRTERTISILMWMMIGNLCLTMLWYVVSLTFADDHVPAWLVALGCLQFITHAGLFAAILYRNFNPTIALRLLRQTNIWILLVLVAVFAWSSAMSPHDSVVVPLSAAVLISSTLFYIGLDGVIVVSRTPRLALGFLGAAVCLVGLVLATFVDVDKDVALIGQAVNGDSESTGFHLTKRDVQRTVFVNVFILLAESVLQGFQDKQMARFMFVREPRPRELVLLTEVMTRNDSVNHAPANPSMELRTFTRPNLSRVVVVPM
eukprot:c20181_g1_i1.p1 GENE.c20181_g1_i1~~c20181_g1_i1.p1  ORF type:complete len:505 (+),score=118.92 c20181_g1_i1:145-1515(+)